MVAAGDGARFRPRARLVRSAEYRALLRRGVRIDGPLFLLVAARNARGYARLGLTVSRRLGGATDRNRARRLLRESFRRTMSEGAEGFDLLLIPKRDILARGQAEVEREFRDSLRRLAARGRAPGRGPARPAAD